MALLQAFSLGSVNAAGGTSNDNTTNISGQTSFSLWSLTQAEEILAAAHEVEELRPTGVRRYEENHPALVYNGRPFNGAVSWLFNSPTGTSSGQVARRKRSATQSR